MLAGYFGYYYSQTGAFFYRFHILAQTSLNYLEDFDLAGFYAHRLPRRLTYEPLFFFMASGIMVPFAFASGAWILTKKVSFFKLDKPEYFWHLVSGLVLLQFWFAPTSTADYIPITLVPRMATILVPPLCISAAYALTYFTGGNRKAAIYFSFIFLVCCFFDRNNTVVMYIALFLYFGWQAWRMRKPGFTVSAPFMVLVLTAVLVLRPLHFMRKPSVMEFQQQDKIVKEELNKPAGKHLVYTDPWTIMMYDFHYDFKPNAGYVYREFSAQKADSGKFDAVYLLVNRKGLINPDMAKLQTIQEDSLSRLFPVKKILRKEGEVRLFQLK